MRYEEIRSQVLALMSSEDPTAAFEAERVLRAWLASDQGDQAERADAFTRLGEVLCNSGRPMMAFPELERAAEFATTAYSQLFLWTVEALCGYRAGDRIRAKKLLPQLELLRRAWPGDAAEYSPWLYKWEASLCALLGNSADAMSAANQSLEAAERLNKGRPEAYGAKMEAHSLAGEFQEAILYGNLAVSASSGRCRYEALVQLVLVTSKAKETRLLDGLARQLRDTAPHPYRDVQAVFAKVIDELIQIDPVQARQFLSHFLEGMAS